MRSCVWGACVRACAHIWPILCVCVSLSACSQSRPRETEIEREKERKRQGSKEKESLERTGMNHKADILVICVAWTWSQAPGLPHQHHKQMHQEVYSNWFMYLEKHSIQDLLLSCRLMMTDSSLESVWSHHMKKQLTDHHVPQQPMCIFPFNWVRTLT